MEIRNIAIIAHVDHGKTTLTDALMHQTGMAEDGVSMDSNALELERGITIYSKNASLLYKGTKINLVDTPGHADFGSEVERILRSIDSVLLVVDAQDGPLPQTKFVLKKSLELGLKPIVVINKTDKPAARVQEVEELILELFMDLGANDEQCDFPVIYAAARQGIARLRMEDEPRDLSPILDTILEKVPAASSPEASALPFRIQPFNLAYDNYIGRLAICRIYEGTIRSGDLVVIKQPGGQSRGGKINQLFTFNGLKREAVAEAVAGDIVMIAGLPDIYIGETICRDPEAQPLPAIAIDEPTISLNFLVNDSPFAGQDGKFVTSRQIRARLERELEVNVGLRVEFDANDCFKVYGRGELHVAILLENMRREGYELQVSQPTVIYRRDAQDRLLEPYEEAVIDVPGDMTGIVIEKMSKRRGRMTGMRPEFGQIRMTFEIPTRGLLGYRGEFIMDTRGEGILCARFIGFKPYAGEIEKHDLGSMVSMENGKALAYALWNLQERGAIYINPNAKVYEGMVVGSVSRGDDMAVNPTRSKKLTNTRASGSDDSILLTPPVPVTLERGLEIMREDEYLEITPKHIRLRKIHLTLLGRVRAERRKLIAS